MRESTKETLTKVQNLAGLGHKEEAKEELTNLQLEYLEVLDEMGVTMNVKFSPALLLSWMEHGIGADGRVVRLAAVTPENDGFYSLMFMVEDAAQEEEEEEETTETSSGDSPEPVQ